MEPRTVLALTAAVLVVTSGFVGLQFLDGDGHTLPDADVEARFESIRTLEATQVSTVDYGNNTTRSRTVLRLELDGSMRLYQRVLAPEKRAGDRITANESTALVYDASENTVTRIPRVGGASRDRGAYYARIVEAARSDEHVKPPSQGISPVPVVPATTTAPDVPENAIRGYDVTYVGTQTVAGRKTHGFRMTASSEAAMNLTQTLWLDADYFYPLKVHRTLHLDNKTVEVSAHLENVSFNAGLSDEELDLDAPANATRDALNFSTRTFDSAAALAGHASMSVPEPELPDSYHLESAIYVTGNRTEMALRYASKHGTLVASKLGAATELNTTQGASVTVVGQDGRYVATSRSSLVTWTCGGHRYSVVATALTKQELLDVAASMACE